MSQADIVSSCARILFATSRGWSAGDGSTSTLADARAMLARLVYALDGKGFPAPASDETIKQNQDAWKACVVAANAAKDANGDPTDSIGHVVFWIADPVSSGKLTDAAGLGLNWPFQPESHISRVSGPILDGSDPRPKRLFFFDAIAEEAAIELDGSASRGFWPRSAAGQRKASGDGSQTAQAGTDAAAGAAPRPFLATGIFVLCVVGGFILVLWLWLLGDTMRNAAANFQSMTHESMCVGNAAGNTPNQAPATWPGSCDAEWMKAWTNQEPGANDSYRWLRMRFWLPLDEKSHLSLLLPFVLTMVSISLLMLATGLATKGQWFGVLIDDRNRISLSRTQQVAWTILLLAGMSTMGWVNAAAISAHSTQTGVELFPIMSGALWTALGVNLVASPYLSDLILDSKDPMRQVTGPGQQQPAGVLGIRQVVTPARLDTNASPAKAGWIDLITGETQGTDQQVDVSRIQHLVISGGLLSTYFMALASSLEALGGQPIVTAIMQDKAFFPDMPPVGGTTFVGLLGLSHAGYLVFKARKGEGTDPKDDSQKAG